MNADERRCPDSLTERVIGTILGVAANRLRRTGLVPQPCQSLLHYWVALHLDFVASRHSKLERQDLLLEPALNPRSIHRPFGGSWLNRMRRAIHLKVIQNRCRYLESRLDLMAPHVLAGK